MLRKMIYDVFINFVISTWRSKFVRNKIQLCKCIPQLLCKILRKYNGLMRLAWQNKTHEIVEQSNQTDAPVILHACFRCCASLCGKWVCIARRV